MRPAGNSREFWLAFALVAGFSLLPVWAIGQLPYVDYPQHAAQVSILRHWSDPACTDSALYTIQWFTPYWLCYALAYALSWLVGADAALRVLLTLYLVASAWVTRSLLRDHDGDEWWALLVFPAGFCYPFEWGFVSFLVAVPLVLAIARLAFRFSARPRASTGLLLGSALAALFVAHILALAFALAIVGALLALSSPSWRELPRRLWPLALALPIPLAWWLSSWGAGEAQSGRVIWRLGWNRVGELPQLLTGMTDGILSALLVAFALAALAVAGARPAALGRRWIPVATTLALILCLPVVAFRTVCLAPRFAVFLTPLLLLCFRRGGRGDAPGWRHAQLAVVSCLLVLASYARFVAVASQGRGLDELLRDAPAGQRLLYLNFDATSDDSRYPVFLHFGQWYAIDRCGVAERSFAHNFPSPVRFGPAWKTNVPPEIEYAPGRFRWDANGGDAFDLFLVHAPEAPAAEKIAGAPGRISLVDHRESWWLYQNVGRAARDPGPTR